MDVALLHVVRDEQFDALVLVDLQLYGSATSAAALKRVWYRLAVDVDVMDFFFDLWHIYKVIF